MPTRPTPDRPRFAGNLVGHFWTAVERIPDPAWSHVTAYLAGVVTALLIAATIAAASL